MYFETAGPHNTEKTLQIAFDHAHSRNLEPVVVATTSGATGTLAAEMGREREIAVLAVTHNTGFATPGEQQLEEPYRRRIENAGARIYTGTLVTRGLGSAIRKRYGWSEEELVAATLRLFGQGAKVCAEMAAMAADAGLVPIQDCVFVAGTGSGADTAMVIQPAPSNRYFEIRIREVLVKPRDF